MTGPSRLTVIVDIVVVVAVVVAFAAAAVVVIHVIVVVVLLYSSIDLSRQQKKVDTLLYLFEVFFVARVNLLAMQF